MEKKIVPNSEEFFQKYGFTQSCSMPHPIYKDTMTFTGLEAEYVGRLEREVEHYKRAFMEQVDRNQQLQVQEYYRLRDEIKKLKFETDAERTTVGENNER